MAGEVWSEVLSHSQLRYLKIFTPKSNFKLEFFFFFFLNVYVKPGFKVSPLIHWDVWDGLHS